MASLMTCTNSTITICCNGGTLQTTMQTIEKCPKLLEKLDNATNKISLGIEYPYAKLVLDYLRGYYDHSALYKIPHEAIELGLLPKDDGTHIIINIGGKYFYLNRKTIASKLSYFEKFFDFHKDLHPDYSSILIDRSPTVFDNVLKYITSTSVLKKSMMLVPSLLKDLDYYQYNNPLDKSFIIKNPNSIHSSRYDLNPEFFEYATRFSSVYPIITPRFDKKCFETYDTYRIFLNNFKCVAVYFDKKYAPDDICDITVKSNDFTINKKDIVLDKKMSRLILLNTWKQKKYSSAIGKQNTYCPTVDIELNNKFVVKSVYAVENNNIERSVYNFDMTNNSAKLDCSTNFVVADLNQLINFPDFYVNKITFTSNKPFIIENIKIKFGENDVAQIGGIHIYNKGVYCLNIKDTVSHYIYTFARKNNAKIYIYFDKPLNQKIELQFEGKFKMVVPELGLGEEDLSGDTDDDMMDNIYSRMTHRLLHTNDENKNTENNQEDNEIDEEEIEEEAELFIPGSAGINKN